MMNGFFDTTNPSQSQAPVQGQGMNVSFGSVAVPNNGMQKNSTEQKKTPAENAAINYPVAMSYNDALFKVATTVTDQYADRLKELGLKFACQFDVSRSGHYYYNIHVIGISDELPANEVISDVDNVNDSSAKIGKENMALMASIVNGKATITWESLRDGRVREAIAWALFKMNFQPKNKANLEKKAVPAPVPMPKAA